MNLVGKTSAEISRLLTPHVDRDFRCSQVARWVLDRNAATFGEMTNLPASLRERLAQTFALTEPEVVEVVDSSDDSRKYLLRLEDGVTVESVAMRDGPKVTFCLSSQAGCAVGCTFCVTGAMGAGRNLRPDEIVGQYRVMLRDLESAAERVNVVFMGMGEPFMNYDNVLRAGRKLNDPGLFNIGARHISISTSGVVPGIKKLSTEAKQVNCLVSLPSAYIEN